MQRSTMLGDKEDIGQPIVMQRRTDRDLLAQVLGRTGMQRHEP
jgi:hypothetical protein